MLHLLEDEGLFALGAAVLIVAGLVVTLLQLVLAGRARLGPLVLGLPGASLALGIAGTGLGVVQTLHAMSVVSGPPGPLVDATLSVSLIPTELACLGSGLVALVWGAGAALDQTLRKARS